MTSILGFRDAAGCTPGGASGFAASAGLKGAGEKRDWLASCVPVPFSGWSEGAPSLRHPAANPALRASRRSAHQTGYHPSPPPIVLRRKPWTVCCFRLRPSGAHVPPVRCAPQGLPSLHPAQSVRRRIAPTSPLHSAIRIAQTQRNHTLRVIPTYWRNLNTSRTLAPERHTTWTSFSSQQLRKHYSWT